eukprot:scaffold28854_cov65-Phaeocystis_antarctica.AAC.4
MTRRTPQGGPCLSCACGVAPAGPGTGRPRGGYPPATRTRSDGAPPATLTSTPPGGDPPAPRTWTSEKAAQIG